MDTDKETIYNILKTPYFYSFQPKIRGGNESLRTGDIINDLTKIVEKVLHPTTEFENSSADELQSEGMENIIPCNIISKSTRSIVLLGLKPTGRTDTLTRASNLLVEIYKKGERQNKKQ